MSSALHRIVVVGGGAGGLELVSHLGRRLGKHQGRGVQKAIPVLVDASPTHIWKPLLHEVATGAFNTGEDEVNYFAHGHENGYEFEFGRMEGLDRKNKTIQLGQLQGMDGYTYVRPREVPYDTLVMSVGAVTNDFGTPGVAENCICLNTPADAEYLRTRILGQALSVVTGNSAVPKLRIGIIGGGATGVELAAEIHHTICFLKHYGGEQLQNQLQITIMEGMDRILNGAPENLSTYATEELRSRNVEVKTNCQIKAVTPEGFIFQDGTLLPAELKIWTAGIKAPDWLKQIGLPVSRTNQILVNDHLQCIDDPSIFGIGDCISAPDVQSKIPGARLPATAQVAHQQAKWLTKHLIAKLENRTYGGKPFVYKPKGIVVSLGEKSAAASLVLLGGPNRRFYFDGLIAKFLYASLYRMHQAVLQGWTRTFMLWLGSKLRKVAHPQLSLH